MPDTIANIALTDYFGICDFDKEFVKNGTECQISCGALFNPIGSIHTRTSPFYLRVTAKADVPADGLLVSSIMLSLSTSSSSFPRLSFMLIAIFRVDMCDGCIL